MADKFETLIDLIAHLADYGDRPALITLTKQDVQQHSFRELSQRVESLARGLHSRGIRDGARVALLADNSPQWLALALAAIRAGGVTMPLDGQMEQDNLKSVLKDGEPSLLFTGETGARRVAELGLEESFEVIRLDREEGEDSWRRLLDGEHGQSPPAANPENTAVLFYTSGTTGPPKGVPLKHRNLVFQLNTIRQSDILREGDRILMPLPLHHVYPFALGLMVPLGMGLPLIFPHSRTGPQIVRAIREGETTVVLGVPRLYSALYQGIQSRAESAGR
ncbi:MAG: AMP-binding protein, partial [Candidatus Competibacteraceae bacterium]|nr:AMP-binding protein [Candidatus Competibacteraceae bacterium]